MSTELYHKTVGQGPPLVLLHGWGFHSDIWEPLVPSLSQHFTLQLIDLPGFGRNPAVADYKNLDNIINEILKIIPEKASYLGWSLGGLILYELSKKIPYRIDKLFFVGSTPCFSEKENWPGLPQEILQNFSQELVANPQSRWKRFITEHLKNIKLTDISYRDFIKIFTNKCPSHLTLTSAINFLITADYRYYQRELKTLQYYFFGEKDSQVPVEIAKKLNHSDFSKIIIFDDAQHLSFLSHKEIFISYLIQFLKNNASFR